MLIMELENIVKKGSSLSIENVMFKLSLRISLILIVWIFVLRLNVCMVCMSILMIIVFYYYHDVISFISLFPYHH